MASEYRKAIGFDDPEFSDRILVIQHHPAISATTRSSSIQALDHTDDSGNAININGKRPLVKGEESAAKRSKEEGAEEKEETKEEEAKEEVKKVVYRKVHVSKLLLSRASAFFQTLFTGPMKEGRETEVAIHVKTEQEASTFVEMLRWIYEPQFPAATTGADYFRLLMVGWLPHHDLLCSFTSLIRSLPINFKLAACWTFVLSFFSEILRRRVQWI